LQSELSSAAAKASEEREFLRSLNETLLANQKDFGTKLQQAQAAMADKDAQLQDLQEQVRYWGCVEHSVFGMPYSWRVKRNLAAEQMAVVPPWV
jgi:hypothetical protein